MLKRIMDDIGHVEAIVRDLAALGPEAAFERLFLLWTSLELARTYRDRYVAQTRLLRGLRTANPSLLLPMLDVAMTSKDLAAQRWACELLKPYALREFAADWGSYSQWIERFRGIPLDEVVRASAREFVERLRSAPSGGSISIGAELRAALRLDPIQANHLLEAGLDALLRDWFAEGTAGRAALALQVFQHGGGADGFLRERVLGHQDTRDEVERLVSSGPQAIALQALRILTQPELSESDARRLVVPLLTARPELRPWVLETLGSGKSGWALELLLPFLRHEDLATVRGAAEALARLGDGRAVRPMIEALKSRNTAEMIYAVGIPLSGMVGVEHDPSHDGPWWEKWWTEHGAGLIPGGK